jgi:hypothetical protein
MTNLLVQEDFGASRGCWRSNHTVTGRSQGRSQGVGSGPNWKAHPTVSNVFAMSTLRRILGCLWTSRSKNDDCASHHFAEK